jgi:hypothetical protein
MRCQAGREIVHGFGDHRHCYVSRNDTVLGYAVNISCISLGVLWRSGEVKEHSEVCLCSCTGPYFALSILQGCPHAAPELTGRTRVVGVQGDRLEN